MITNKKHHVCVICLNVAKGRSESFYEKWGVLRNKNPKKGIFERKGIGKDYTIRQ